jgi:hypothetical protein
MVDCCRGGTTRYTAGAGRKPPYLAGRDKDLDDFASLIEVLASVLITQPLGTSRDRCGK